MAGNLVGSTLVCWKWARWEVRDGREPVVLRICGARSCCVDVWRIGLWQKGTQQRVVLVIKPGGRSGLEQRVENWGTRHTVAWQLGHPAFPTSTAKLTLFASCQCLPSAQRPAPSRTPSLPVSHAVHNTNESGTHNRHHSTAQHGIQVTREKRGSNGECEVVKPLHSPSPSLSSSLGCSHVLLFLFFACDARSAPHC